MPLKEVEPLHFWREETRLNAQKCAERVLEATDDMAAAEGDEAYYYAYKRRKERLRDLFMAIGINRHGWP